jgi:hypothetical protein
MVNFAGVYQVVASAPTDIDAVPVIANEGEAGIVNVSRWAQVFLVQLLAPPDA